MTALYAQPNTLVVVSCIFQSGVGNLYPLASSSRGGITYRGSQKKPVISLDADIARLPCYKPQDYRSCCDDCKGNANSLEGWAQILVQVNAGI